MTSPTAHGDEDASKEPAVSPPPSTASDSVAAQEEGRPRVPGVDDAVREVLGMRPLSQELIEVGGMFAAQFAVRRAGLQVPPDMRVPRELGAIDDDDLGAGGRRHRAAGGGDEDRGAAV
jgi:hypothetical protein